MNNKLKRVKIIPIYLWVSFHKDNHEEFNYKWIIKMKDNIFNQISCILLTAADGSTARQLLHGVVMDDISF